MSKNYKVSIKTYNDIRKERGCYLKYNKYYMESNKYYMDLANKSNSTEEFITLFPWMFGETTRGFGIRNTEESRSDASTPNNGYEHILVVKTNQPEYLEKIFKIEAKGYKECRKELYRCELNILIGDLKKCIDICSISRPEFEYEICIIKDTRYTEYLKNIFGIKKTFVPKNKKSPTIKTGIYKHSNGFIVYYDDVTNRWKTENTEWESLKQFAQKTGCTLRSLNYSYTSHKNDFISALTFISTF